ncbi:uncharacterized protein HD556DRAFT_1213571, partial [Suillus plorans]
WTAPVYVSFRSTPTIEYINNCRCHSFQCAATNCKYKTREVRRYLDTGDAKSMGNMHKHTKKCWG